jgi:hypothetical protein
VAGGTSKAFPWATLHNSTNHLSFTRKTINIARWAGRAVTIYVEQNDNTPAGAVGFDKEIYVDNVRIEAAPAPTPTPSAMPGIDSDGDGLLDSWETDGIPYEDSTGIEHRYLLDCNHDGQSDADPQHKDVFVEIDSMNGPGLTPTAADLQPVVTAFANSPAPNPGPSLGIDLHLCFDETDLPVVDLPNWSDFDAVAIHRFGTRSERADPNALEVIDAKRQAFHYAIFASTCCGDSTSGLGESPGNEFLVSLGGWRVPGGTQQQKAGTFMHELGHNLGLGHGGRDAILREDPINWKPNYFSVMNYLWSTPHPWMKPGTWPLDPDQPGYSSEALANIDERSLDECAAVGTSDMLGYVEPYTALVRGNTTVFTGVLGLGFDWNGDGVPPASCDVRFASDVNRLDGPDTPGELLVGRQDWSNLVYDFRQTPSFANGTHDSHQGPGLTSQLNDKIDHLLPPYDQNPAAQKFQQPGSSAGAPDAAATLAASTSGAPGPATTLAPIASLPIGVVAIAGLLVVIVVGFGIAMAHRRRTRP